MPHCTLCLAAYNAARHTRRKTSSQVQRERGMEDDSSVSGRIVVVTGATHGIGRRVWDSDASLRCRRRNGAARRRRTAVTFSSPLALLPQGDGAPAGSPWSPRRAGLPKPAAGGGSGRRHTVTIRSQRCRERRCKFAPHKPQQLAPALTRKPDPVLSPPALLPPPLGAARSTPGAASTLAPPP